ncbi:MAG: glycosyltransferase [Polaribacter sp.]|uniref:glycosyltransferase n=1 Tax=Polaribacter sp. TaxID=1920175 RepID=UPI003266C282
MKKLSVIQIIDSLNTGGAEVLAVNLANLLYEEKIDSHICVTRKEGALKKNINSNLGYIFLNRKLTLDIKAIYNLTKYIRKNNIKIIHAHSSSLFIAFCVKIINFKIKIIWHDHYGKSEELPNRSSIFLNIMSFFVDTIISVNSNLKKWAQHKLSCKKVFFVNNFSTFNNFDKKTFLKGLEGKRIVHLAALRPQKDHETLIKAFHLFCSKKKDWTLHLIGSILNDNYSSKILDLIESKDLKKHIFVYGSKLDIYHILNQSSIGVLSSKSEGLPIALLEYGLANLPVIVTDVGECGKVVKQNESGIVVAPSNFEALFEAMLKISNSKELAEKYKKKHHLNVLKKYSKKQFVKKVVKIYIDK